MADKRDECGCHRECTMTDHLCERPCRWPACLTAEEEAELVEKINRDLW